MKKKIVVLITARSSISKLLPILQILNNDKSISLKIVCGFSSVLQKYGNSFKIFTKYNLKVDYLIDTSFEDNSLVNSAKSTGLGIVKIADILDLIKPDALILMADRYEVISGAIAASYQNIPIIHIQGGEMTGNIDNKVRHSISKLADYHYVSTLKSKFFLIKTGEPKNRVFFTGCPSIDIAKQISKKKISNNILKKYNPVGDNFDLNKPYIIIMFHPVTTEIEKNKRNISELFYGIKNLKVQKFWFWPNSDPGTDDLAKFIRKERERDELKSFTFFKNLDPNHFLIILKNSNLIIGNSSAGIRESSFLGTPSINLGNRQKNRERGKNTSNCKFDKNKIYSLCKKFVCKKKKYKREFIYGNGSSSFKILKLIKETNFTLKNV